MRLCVCVFCARCDAQRIMAHENEKLFKKSKPRLLETQKGSIKKKYRRWIYKIRSFACASLIASFLLSFCRDIESRSRKSDESSFSFLIDKESLARYTSAMSEIVFF